MKIALFSDIHANLPAFKAFLSNVESQRPDAMYCLGDLIGYHIWPNEIIDEIRRRGIVTIAGNHDLKVKNLNHNEGASNNPGELAYAIVNQANREYLLSLPSGLTLQFDSVGNVLLAHGSPRQVDEYVLQDTPEEYVLELMADARILCVGHSHKPYHRLVDNGKRHVINTGSVGKPKDGDPRGCYVLLTVSPYGGEQVLVEFVRFDYDVEEAAKAIENSLLPIELADRLRGAY